MCKIWCACMHFSLLVRGVVSRFCLVLKRVCDSKKVKNRGNRARPACLKFCFMELNGLGDVVKSSCGQIGLGNIV